MHPLRIIQERHREREQELAKDQLIYNGIPVFRIRSIQGIFSWNTKRHLSDYNFQILFNSIYANFQITTRLPTLAVLPLPSLQAHRISQNSEHEIIIQKKKCLLILELPFKTDAVSLNESRVKTFETWAKRPLLTLDDYVKEDEIRDKKNPSQKCFSPDKIYKNKFLKNFITNNIFKLEIKIIVYGLADSNIKIADIPEQDLCRPWFFQLIKEIINNARHVKGDLIDEKRRGKKKGRKLQNEIGQSTLPKRKIFTRSKKTYLSCFKKVLEYIAPAKWSDKESWCGPGWFQEGRADLQNLANYFEYLEQRYLISRLEQHCLDLIKVRLIYYTKLSYSKLKTLKLNQINM